MGVAIGIGEVLARGGVSRRVVDTIPVGASCGTSWRAMVDQGAGGGVLDQKARTAFSGKVKLQTHASESLRAREETPPPKKEGQSREETAPDADAT
jgi:hypothetical protein